MTRWAVFAGVTVLVLGCLLALARVSQVSMDGGSNDTDGVRRNRHTAPPSGSNEDAFDTGVPAHEHRGMEPGGTASPDTVASGSLSTGLLLANVALSQGLFLVLLVGSAWYARIPLTALGASAASISAPTVVLGAGLGVSLYLLNELGSLGANAVGIETPERLRASLAPDSAAGWVVLLGIVLPVIAVFEEFLFRAALVGGLSAGFALSPWLLALLSSVAFALGHGAQGTIGMVATGGLGFVLAAAFVLSGSLLVVVVAHYLVNALEFVVHEGISVERPG